MKKTLFILTLIVCLVSSCSKNPTTGGTTPTTTKSYTPLFKKNVQWDFAGYKFTKSKDTNYLDPSNPMTLGGDLILGSRVIFFEDFRVNTRRNGNNTGPNACNDYDCKLIFDNGTAPPNKDSSFISIHNQYNNSLGHCAMFQGGLKILNFTDSTMTVFYLNGGSAKEIPEYVQMYYLKIYK